MVLHLLFVPAILEFVSQHIGRILIVSQYLLGFASASAVSFDHECLSSVILMSLSYHLVLENQWQLRVSKNVGMSIDAEHFLSEKYNIKPRLDSKPRLNLYQMEEVYAGYKIAYKKKKKKTVSIGKTNNMFQ